MTLQVKNFVDYQIYFIDTGFPNFCITLRIFCALPRSAAKAVMLSAVLDEDWGSHEDLFRSIVMLIFVLEGAY